MKHLATFILLQLMLLSILPALSHAQLVVGTQNYSVQYANATINAATAYVDKINASSYLIFTPDLSKSYSYLMKADSLYMKSPDVAVAYSYLAKRNAQEEYMKISSYKSESFMLLLGFSVAMLAILYYFSKPVKSLPSKRSSPKNKKSSTRKKSRRKTK